MMTCNSNGRLDRREFLNLLDEDEATAIIDLEEILGRSLKILPQEAKNYVQGFWLEGRHVVGLNLESGGLKYLPESVGNLIHLRWLYLLENNLMTLPDSIDNCTSLELLDLRDNRLHSKTRN